MLLRKFLSPLSVSTSSNNSSSSSSSRNGGSSTRGSSSGSARSKTPQLHGSGSFELKEAREPPQVPDKDRFAHWFLHHTFQRRSYQCTAVREALFQNTLISIPHGFGRKYVAGAIMLNFFKWFPEGKVVFTSSLHSAVTKQAKLCRKFGIEKKFIAVLTADVALEERIALWQMRRAIFVSPTLLQNDLRMGAYDCKGLKCIVFDDSQKRIIDITSTLNRVNASLTSTVSPKSNDEDTGTDTDFNTTTGFYRTVVFSDLVAAPAASLFQQGVVSHAECFVERDPDIISYYSEGAKVLLVTRTTPQVRAVCQALDERFIRYHLGALHRAGIAFKAGPAGEVCGDATRVMKILCATKAALPHMHRMDLYTLYALFNCRDTLLVNGPTSFLVFVSRMGDVSYVAKYCNFHTRRDWADFVEFCKETFISSQQKHLQVSQSAHRHSSSSSSSSSSSQRLCSRSRSPSPSPSSSSSYSLYPSRGFAAAPPVSPHPKLTALENLLRKHFRKCPGCRRAVVLTHFEESRQDILRWLGGLRHIVRVEGDGSGGSSSSNSNISSLGSAVGKASLPCVVVTLESKSAQVLSDLCGSDSNGNAAAIAGQRALVVCFEYESFASVRVQCSGIKSAAKVVALAAPGEQEAVSRRLGELGAAEKRASLAKLYAAMASGSSEGNVLGQPSPRMVPSSVTSPSLCILRGNNGTVVAGTKKTKKRKLSGDNG